jgi:endonuclease/exonuclease/phosphatase (EEP) superfamily protein YafD
VATFNTWGKGYLQIERAEVFFAETDADVVVLQEVGSKHEKLLQQLQQAYPHQEGKRELVILSRYPVVDGGWLDRPRQRCRLSPIAKWARVDVNGRGIDVVAVHMVRPFRSALQKSDFNRLNRFLKSKTGLVIVAGDFNATPWTRRFHGLLAGTGLKRLNTFAPTWPVHWRNLPLLPVLPIDHILVSEPLAKIDVWVCPRLRSDHLPVIADIALVE